MKKIIITLLMAFAITSCTVTTPIAATSNPIGSKVGTSTARRVCCIWVQPDASIQTAAKNGNITKISTVDITRRRGLFIFKIVTTVTGE